MEMQLFPWIRDDIAVEIIGKMIAEQTEQLYDLLREFDWAGFERDDPEVLSHPKYQEIMKNIRQFKSEIDDIYTGIRLEALYKKIETVYVPYLNYKSGDLIVK
ncbi:hypothetical protein WBJ53_16460 [Spirosoma sp. SC4-14]|uniref:hypothetical protein n=1 Tax=Spirosoma sp. SC4-14 TaxID=3128900 RepID=UPI0030CD37AC